MNDYLRGTYCGNIYCIHIVSIKAHVNLIYDTLVLVVLVLALFIKYEMKMQECDKSFHFRFCA